MKLEEIEKLCNEATEGPWEYHHCGEDVPDDESMYDWFVIAPAVKGYSHFGNDGVAICSNSSNHDNGRFIAMARSEIPKLLAVAKAAQHLLDWRTYPQHQIAHSAIDRRKNLDKALEELEEKG